MMAVVVVRRRGREVSLLHKEVDETLEVRTGAREGVVCQGDG